MTNPLENIPAWLFLVTCNAKLSCLNLVRDFKRNFINSNAQWQSFADIYLFLPHAVWVIRIYHFLPHALWVIRILESRICLVVDEDFNKIYSRLIICTVAEKPKVNSWPCALSVIDQSPHVICMMISILYSFLGVPFDVVMGIIEKWISMKLLAIDFAKLNTRKLFELPVWEK